jgi:site-specific recombinase XerD
MYITELAEDWLYELSITKSGRTVSAYNTPLRHFLRFCDEKDRSLVTDLQTSDVPAFVRWFQKQKEVGKSTIALYTTALSRFYRFALMENEAAFDWGDYEKLKERLKDFSNGWKKKTPRVPDPESVDKLFTEAYKHMACPRDRILRLRNIALLEALRSTGARVSEIANLQISELDHDLHLSIIKGKGEKERIIFFDDKAWAALEAYLEAREAAVADLPVWIRHDNAKDDHLIPLHPNSIREAIYELCDRAGIEQITPHQFRHQFAMTILKGTSGNLAITQDLLGHSNPNTTRIYTQLLPEELRRVHMEVMNG